MRQSGRKPGTHIHTVDLVYEERGYYELEYSAFQIIDLTVARVLSRGDLTIRRGRGYISVSYCTTLVTHIPGLFIVVSSGIVP